MQILVTGATGFIGGRVAHALLQRDHRVVVNGRDPERLTPLAAAGATARAGDLGRPDTADALLSGCEAVVHCGGLAGTWGPYTAYHRANVLATEHLLAAARRRDLRRFVNLSSASVYVAFRHQFDLGEDDLPPRFASHYARSKFAAEQRVLQAHGASLATVSLRPRFVIGAGDTNILPRVIEQARAGRLLQIGAGDHRVDVTSVDNLVDAVLLCLEAPASALGTVYNISNGQPVQFWRFVDEVLATLSLPSRRHRVPLPVAMNAARANQLVQRLLRRKSEPKLSPLKVSAMAHSMTLDISRARRQLGYQPRQSTGEAIREFAGWWRASARAAA
jgi:hypothetical protein